MQGLKDSVKKKIQIASNIMMDSVCNMFINKLTIKDFIRIKEILYLRK